MFDRRRSVQEWVTAYRSPHEQLTAEEATLALTVQATGCVEDMHLELAHIRQLLQTFDAFLEREFAGRYRHPDDMRSLREGG